jgi:hypothetical protein
MMNPRRSRPKSSAYWSSLRLDKPEKPIKPKVSKSANYVNQTVSASNLRPPYEAISKLSIGFNTQMKKTTSKNEKRRHNELTLSEFRLLHRQTNKKSRLVSASPETKAASLQRKKYVVRGHTIESDQNAATITSYRRTLSRASHSTVVLRKPSTSTVGRESKTTKNNAVGRGTLSGKTRMKDFTYEDLNPNYLIDQYYYNRKALSKTKKNATTAALTNLKKYVNNEMNKESNYVPNRVVSKVQTHRSTTSRRGGFFGDYYTDGDNVTSGEFTVDKKVRIWLERSSLQARASKGDILNAWTEKI